MKYSLAGVKPYLAIPVNREFPWQTTQSLMETASKLTALGVQYETRYITGGSIIHSVRSKLATDFLKTQGCTHLFWLDSDVAWSAEAFVKLLCLGTKYDLVGAAYPSKVGHGDYLVSMQVDERGCVVTSDEGLVPMAGMGIGFTCCSRKVIGCVAAVSPVVQDADAGEVTMVFDTPIEGGCFIGEDIAFFRKAKKLGFQLWADPSIELGHVGSKEWRGKFSEVMRKVVE